MRCKQEECFSLGILFPLHLRNIKISYDSSSYMILIFYNRNKEDPSSYVSLGPSEFYRINIIFKTSYSSIYNKLPNLFDLGILALIALKITYVQNSLWGILT